MNNDQWQDTPPDSEGWWWLYGDDEFGSCGGNYTGAWPPEIRLHTVQVSRTGDDSFIGVCSGRFLSLTPFNPDKRQSGYIGKWRKIDLPELPTINVDAYGRSVG